MQIKRCAILLIEPRETLSFSLDSLCNGGDGIAAHIDLIALAPHLDAEVPVSADDVGVLNALLATHWQSFDSVAARFSASLLRDLLDKGLLIGDDVAHDVTRTRDAALHAAHWHAHSAVSHYFGRWHGVTAGGDQATAALCTMADLAARLGTPPSHVVDRVDAAMRMALPAIKPTPFDDMLARRATCRNFDSHEKLDKYSFAHVLHRVFAAQATYDIHPGNTVIKRTSPSGGSLHPIDAYLLVQHVEGIEPGIYHYHSIDHALEPLPLPVGDLKTLASTMVGAQEYYVDAAVMVVLVARFPRTFWKYRSHSKAYRVSILDAGHLSQMLYLSATEFGLGAFITAAINEVDIEQAFGLDALIESPLAVCGFGRRSDVCKTFEFDPNRAVWPNGVALPE